MVLSYCNPVCTFFQPLKEKKRTYVEKKLKYLKKKPEICQIEIANITFRCYIAILKIYCTIIIPDNRTQKRTAIMEKYPKFTVLYEKLRGKSFEINCETMSIGRKDSADIQLADGSVSGHHADIIRTERDGKVCYLLRDNDSTNGTKINNEPIAEQILKNSDLISFGHVEVLFDGVEEQSDDSHITHTIDLGSATTNTTTTQTLTNFSVRTMNEKKKNAMTNATMIVVLVIAGLAVLGAVGFTVFRAIS